MNETQAIDEKIGSGYRRLMVMVAASIITSMALVGVSLALYSSSGASQLDLSRPGYSGVSNQTVTKEEDTNVYSETGPIDQQAVDEFRALYKEQSDKIKAIDAFGGDPLGASSLGIDAPTEATQD